MRYFCETIAYDKRKSVNTVLFLFTLLVLAGFIAAGAIYKAGNVSFYGKFPPCPFKTVTGLSCPGCGMTRAVYALYDGNISESLRQNPGIVYFLALFLIIDLSYLIAFIGNLIQRIAVKDASKRKKLHGIYYSNFYIIDWMIMTFIFAAVRMILEIIG